MSAMGFGDTFVIQHLWIVASDPSKHSDKFIIVNLTKDKNRAGSDCELNPGDHPWVKEKSYVNFADAREVGPNEESKILKLMAEGDIKKHFPMKSAVLQRITSAAIKSKALPTGLKSYFEPTKK